MGDLVLSNDELIHGSVEEVFERIAAADGGGWLFDAECDALEPGAVVRLRLPATLGSGEMLGATGRVIAVDRPRRLVIEQHAPWRGRLTCLVSRAPADGGRPQSRVRLVAEVPEEAIHWLLRHRGVPLPPEATGDQQPIGLLVSQSGPANVFAGAAENLARLAVEEINADGPPLGRPLRLVVGDDGTSPTMGALAAGRLVEAEGCSVVIASVTSAVFTAASRAMADRSVLLVFSVTNEGGPTGDRLVRLGERPGAQLAVAVPRVMERSDGRRWFLAGNDYCWPQATNACARAAVARAGGTVAEERLVPLGTRDFEPVIDAVQRSGADCVLSTFVGADAAAFERAFYRAGMRARCQTLSPGLDEATREHIGAEAGAGIWSVFGYFEDLPTTENRAFVKRYRDRFGQWAPPPSSLSESAYEAMHLVADAAHRARSWHPTDVGRAMASSRFSGPRGPVALAGPGALRQELFLAESVPGGYAVREAVGRNVGTC
ncbi:MAG: urea transport system substrate-binding protein [Solirubrobacteraceae bacterium]|nr:urea transport system substrate-binding protein [Solirubrobacteraceae bacterium]